MNRLRVLFVVFTLALLAPILLLVQRSLRSLDIERRMQQQTVAERIFDEMERSLSRLLAEEEQRPIDGYETATEGDYDRLVIGRFQADARHSPAEQRREDAAAAADADRASVLDEGEASPIDREIADAFRDRPTAEPEVAQRQAPGTTMRLGDESKQQGIAARAKKNEVSEYDVLRSLNKGVRERIVERIPSSPALSYEGVERQAAVQAAPPEVFDLRAGAFGPGRMSGRAVGANRLMLYRVVAREGTVYHQGVVLDVAELGRWLREQSIGNTRMGKQITTEFFAADADAGEEIAPGSAWFRHRFAAPFSDLSARLRLGSLASADRDLYVPALSFTLIVATLIGLTLLYRTVAVSMRFAERRSNFAAAVSHELKTPLTAIRMYGEMLRDGVVPSESKRNEYYRHITSESERLSRLINNVLEFAKIEKGNRLVRPISASVAPPMLEVVEMMRTHAAELGYELDLQIEDDLPAVRYESDAFTQVLWNLVDNAIKYARGAADKSILLSADAEPGRVRVAVRDHGPGVDSRHLREIFSPFYRGQNELTRTATGAGLGLSLVRSLVERMGATVRARNHPDGGFVVEIFFPVPPD